MMNILNLLKDLSYSDIWFHNNKGKNTRVILSYLWNLDLFQIIFNNLKWNHLENNQIKKFRI